LSPIFDKPNNIFQHSVQVAEYLVVPISREDDASFVQESRTPRIRGLRVGCIVLSTVDLNSELKRGTIKIEYVWADRVLAAKVHLGELVSAERMPKSGFSIRHRVP
jgi:hypothetical protein